MHVTVVACGHEIHRATSIFMPLDCTNSTSFPCMLLAHPILSSLVNLKVIMEIEVGFWGYRGINASLEMALGLYKDFLLEVEDVFLLHLYLGVHFKVVDV